MKSPADSVEDVKSTLKQRGWLLVAPSEPTPKVANSVQRKDRWPIKYTVDRPRMVLDDNLTFASAIYRRRTDRRCMPASLAEVLSLVKLVMMTTSIGTGKNVGRLRKIPISAGALHPIEVLVVAGPEISDPLLYIDDKEIFGAVGTRSNSRLGLESGSLAELLPHSRGHYLLFTANKLHVEQAYQNPESLLWRDAGAYLQTFSLICSAVEFAFVPLGRLGDAILAEIDTPHSSYMAVGTALIGRVLTRAEPVST